MKIDVDRLSHIQMIEWTQSNLRNLQWGVADLKICHSTNSVYIPKIKCTYKILTTSDRNCYIAWIGSLI